MTRLLCFRAAGDLEPLGEVMTLWRRPWQHPSGLSNHVAPDTTVRGTGMLYRVGVPAETVSGGQMGLLSLETHLHLGDL